MVSSQPGDPLVCLSVSNPNIVKHSQKFDIETNRDNSEFSWFMNGYHGAYQVLKYCSQGFSWSSSHEFQDKGFNCFGKEYLQIMKQKYIPSILSQRFYWLQLQRAYKNQRGSLREKKNKVSSDNYFRVYIWPSHGKDSLNVMAAIVTLLEKEQKHSLYSM